MTVEVSGVNPCETGLVAVKALGQVCVLENVLMVEVFETNDYEKKSIESLVCKKYVVVVVEERSGVLRITSKSSVITW